MNFRTIGKDKDKVSIIGFGCMRLPMMKGEDGKIDELEAMKQIRYSIDHGLNYIDTAWPYHGGQSETFVAKVLKDGYREKVLLADKLPSWLIKSREDMDVFLDKQLKKCETEYFDMYLLHALNKNSWANLVENNVFDFIEKALASGKIRNIGFSFHDEFEVFEEIVNSYNWDFCQIQLNFYDEAYQAGVKGLKLAASKGMDVVIMEPLRGGRLATNVPDRVTEIYKETGFKHTAAGWALRYLWNYPEIKVILSGMNNMDHIKDNLNEASNALPNMLTEKEKDAIKSVNAFYKSKIQVDCTSCRYCMPCPHGINIPRNFEMYNNAHVFNNKKLFTEYYYNFLKPDELAEVCLQCGECLPKCPQHINIISELENVAEYFKK